MKDAALVVVDRLHDSTQTLKFIDKVTADTDSKDEIGIHNTFPILFLCKGGLRMEKELMSHAKEELTFTDGVNPAGQGLVEVLELMDITNVYISGADSGELEGELRKAGFNVNTLD
ncbi:MAG: hypothetical protein K5984_07080 [Bacteroidales bacterium]|nr:hypothetical protein [Bacteroidales bacterium]